MKPYKIFGMAMFSLLFFVLLYVGKFNFEASSIFVLVIESIFSFIFPAFIFFCAWLLSFKQKEEGINYLNYYIKILLNLVLPYFLCMIPYIIYNFGINNLSIKEFIKILVEGNIVEQFTYIKTIIEIGVVFPAAIYFIKKNTKVSLIVSLALSAIFSLFGLNTYIHTDVFNYLIYISLGISFSYYKKELIELFRNNNNVIISNLFWTILLVIITKFKIVYFLNPIAEILYNISIIFLISYFCYKWQGYHYRNRKYLFKSLFFNPPIIGTTCFLLIEVVLKIFGEITNTFFITIPEVFLYIIGIIIFVLFLFVINKANDRIEEERYEKLKRMR